MKKQFSAIWASVPTKPIGHGDTGSRPPRVNIEPHIRGAVGLQRIGTATNLPCLLHLVDNVKLGRVHPLTQSIIVFDLRSPTTIGLSQMTDGTLVPFTRRQQFHGRIPTSSHATTLPDTIGEDWRTPVPRRHATITSITTNCCQFVQTGMPIRKDAPIRTTHALRLRQAYKQPGRLNGLVYHEHRATRRTGV